MLKIGQGITNMETFVGLIVLLVLITITINTIIITRTWKDSTKQKREEARSKEKYYLSSMEVKVEDLNILDKIIDQEFTRYQLLKLGHIENLYIKDDMQYQIIHDLSKIVMENISDTLKNKLSLIYRKEYIDDIIVQKIQYVVMQFTIDINGSYRDGKK